MGVIRFIAVYVGPVLFFILAVALGMKCRRGSVYRVGRPLVRPNVQRPISPAYENRGNRKDVTFPIAGADTHAAR